MNDIISIFFQVLNFTILMSIFIHVFRTRFLPSLRRKWHQAQEQIAHLLRLKEEAHQKNDAMVKEIDEQEREAQTILLKIDQWAAIIEKENRQKKIQEECIAHQMRENYKKQMLLYDKERIQQQMIPQAFHEAYKKIVHECNDEYAHQYMQATVDRMKSKQ